MRKHLNLDSIDRTEGVAPEEVRHIENQKNNKDEFKNYTDAQIQELMQTTKMFAAIIYDNWVKEQNSNIVEIEAYQPLSKAA